MITEKPHIFCQFLIAGDNHASVAIAGQVLTRKETKATTVTHGSHFFPFVCRTEGLGAIFNDSKIIFPGQSADRIHIRRMAKEMDRDDRLGFPRNLFLYLAGVDIECVLGYIREDGCCMKEVI